MTTYTGRQKPNKALEASLGIAALSKCEQKHGAVLMRAGKVLGAATNVKKHSPGPNDWRSSHVHAEAAVMKSVPKGEVVWCYYICSTN